MMTDLQVLENLRGMAQALAHQLADDTLDPDEREEIRRLHDSFLAAATLYERIVLHAMLWAPRQAG